VLTYMQQGATLSTQRADKKTTLKLPAGYTIKVGRSTFSSLYFGRYIDPNGNNIEGRDYYKLSEKGLEALK